MALAALAFAQLAAFCSSGDAVSTLASVASVESRLNPLAIHDNTMSKTFNPVSQAEAVAIATKLIVAEQHSVDLGLMQINSANLPRLRITIRDAFDPCRSIAAGSEVLREVFKTALRAALSRYNTGSPDRGLTNGYVQRVEAASIHLPDILEIDEAVQRSHVAALGSTRLPPVVAMDLLHGEKVEASSDKVVNLLPTIPVP